MMRGLLLDQRAQPVRNLAPRPRPDGTATANWTSRWFGGGGGAGALSVVASGGVGDRPFYRKTWTASPTSPEDTGIQPRSTPVTPGRTYTVLARVRSSVATSIRSFTSGLLRVDGMASIGSSGTQLSGGVNGNSPLAAGQWTTLRSRIVVPAGVNFVDVFPYINSAPNGAAIWAAGDTLDMGDFMLVEGVYLGDYCDGAMPGWRWLGTAGLSQSIGWPYTLESLAGKPRWDAEFPALGTLLPGTFNAHTSFSYGDISLNGQRGWIASEPDPNTNRRLEALNISTTVRDPRVRLQGGSFQVGVVSGASPLPADAVISTWWSAAGEIGIRGYNTSTADAIASARSEQAPLPGYRLRSGVRDISTAYGVSLARQIVYDRVLSAAERTSVARWLANRYGTALA